MEKHHIDRRMAQMAAEGVEFRTNVEVGVSLSVDSLLEEYDAVALTGGAEWPRDLPVANRALDGIHFAMDFLSNRTSATPATMRRRHRGNQPISAKGKHVVVIGGGDTGSDCIGTSVRQGAASIAQIEIMPKPPENENKGLVWPDCRTSCALRTPRRGRSHATGRCTPRNAIVRTAASQRSTASILSGSKAPNGRMQMVEVPGSDFQLKADLVLLAMGFLGPKRNALLEQAGVELDARGNVAANTGQYLTSRDRLFAAGDMRRGQSLVVWAIREGRQCARSVDQFLMGKTSLPR